MSPQTSSLLEARAAMLAAGVRTDSRMFSLPLPVFEELAALVFRDRIAPKAALAMIEMEGTPRAALPSLSAFYSWQRDFTPYYGMLSRKQARQAANTVAEDARKSPAEWQAAIADQLGQATFDLMIDPNRDPEVVKNFVNGLLGFAKLDVDRGKLAQTDRRLKMEEAKTTKARTELEKANAPGATDEDRRAIVSRVWEMLGAGKPPEAIA